jgi:predicted PurR-regulated permease PerM
MADPKPTLPQHTLFWMLLFVFLGWFLYLISPILLPFVVGMGMAYILDPFVDKLEKHGLSRTISTSIIFAIFGVIGAGTLFLLLPMVVDQLIGLVQALPRYMELLKGTVEPYIATLTRQFQLSGDDAMQQLSASMEENLTSGMSGILGGILLSGIAVMNFAALLVITPLVSFFLLRDWDQIMREMDDLLPRHHAPVIREQLSQINRTLSAFIRGQLNVMLVLIAYYAIALSLVGLNYALIVALVAGVLIIIPYIGTAISGAIAIGLAYVQFGMEQETFIVVAIFVMGQMMEGYVLTPRLIGQSVGLNALWIIFGMLAGGTIMGFVGTLIAVPFTAVCGVLIRFAVAEYRNSALYSGRDAGS